MSWRNEKPSAFERQPSASTALPAARVITLLLAFASAGYAAIALQELYFLPGISSCTPSEVYRLVWHQLLSGPVWVMAGALVSALVLLPLKRGT